MSLRGRVRVAAGAWVRPEARPARPLLAADEIERRQMRAWLGLGLGVRVRVRVRVRVTARSWRGE